MAKSTTAALSPTAKHKCRVCLQQGEIPISSQNNPLDFPLSHYLKLICNIDITANDTYPKYLCKSCSVALETAIQLRKTAIKTQLKLKSKYLNYYMKNSFNQTDQIKRPELITLLPLQKKKIKDEIKDIQIEAYSRLQKEEIDSAFDDLEQIDNDPEVCVLSPGQKKEINNKYKDIHQKEHNAAVPILTLDQVQKFKARTIPCDKYYEKIVMDNKLTYKCRICKKVYKKCSLTDHLLIHLPDSISQYVCEVCGKTFKKFCSFYKHGIIHKNILPFECKMCPYKGRSKSLLQVHVKRVHKKEYNYQCTLCPRKFLDTNNLRYHLRRHGDPKHQCSTCQKSFYEIGLLKKHIESQHMDTVPLKCDSCGSLYKNRRNLLAHQIKVHKRKQVYNNRATYLRLDSTLTDEIESN